MTEQTLVAQNYLLNTEIAAVRATATVEADRMMITLEHAQTAVRQVDGQTQDLSATLVARGTLVVDTSMITPQAPFVVTTPPPILDFGPAPITPISITPGSASAQTGAIGVPTESLVETTQIAPQSGGPLSNVVLTTEVGPDDCATTPMSTFNSTEDEIYVVALANGIGPNDVVASTWYANNEEVVSYDWSPNFVINNACIWFFIDQSDVAFTPGNWRVQMSVNGAPVGPAVSFTIVEGQPPGDALIEDAIG